MQGAQSLGPQYKGDCSRLPKVLIISQSLLLNRRIHTYLTICNHAQVSHPRRLQA